MHQLFIQPNSLCLSVSVSMSVSFPFFTLQSLLSHLFHFFSQVTSSFISLLLKDFPGTCLSSFDFLCLLPPTCSAHQATSFHYFISLFWHLRNNRLASRFASVSPFSLLLPSVLSLLWVRASSNEQSSSSPGQSKQNQSHIPRAQFAVTSQFCELGIFELEIQRRSWVASGFIEGGWVHHFPVVIWLEEKLLYFSSLQC